MHLEPLSEPIPVPVPGATLVAEAAGDGPAVVLLHAGVVDRRAWRPLAPHLLPGHRLIAYDRRGFGDTAVAESQPVDHVADLLAVLDHLDVDAAVVVGNSMGGVLALDTAMTAPERVRGLVLVGTGWRGGPYPEDAPEVVALETAIEEAEAAGDLGAVNRLEALLWLDGPAGPEGRVGGPARTYFLDANGRALAAGDVGQPTRHEDVWPHLGRLDRPVAVVEGTLDVPGGIELARAATEQLPDAELHVLADVAHLPALERPADLAAIIAATVRRA
jgi:pimeloyl-ACP methyl ester carboxylesterase